MLTEAEFDVALRMISEGPLHMPRLSCMIMEPSFLDLCWRESCECARAHSPAERHLRRLVLLCGDSFPNVVELPGELYRVTTAPAARPCRGGPLLADCPAGLECTDRGCPAVHSAMEMLFRIAQALHTPPDRLFKEHKQSTGTRRVLPQLLQDAPRDVAEFSDAIECAPARDIHTILKFTWAVHHHRFLRKSRLCLLSKSYQPWCAFLLHSAQGRCEVWNLEPARCRHGPQCRYRHACMVCDSSTHAMFCVHGDGRMRCPTMENLRQEAAGLGESLTMLYAYWNEVFKA